jgi:protein TonB
MGEDDPPRVSDAPSGSILPEAGPTDFPASIPRPPTEPQTRILKPAELVHRVDPTYPTIAREQRVQGTVKLRVTIAQDGTVLGVELLSGSPLLTRAAIEAVRQWRYRPTLINGKPVQTNSEISLLFRLP